LYANDLLLILEKCVEKNVQTKRHASKKLSGLPHSFFLSIAYLQFSRIEVPTIFREMVPKDIFVENSNGDLVRKVIYVETSELPAAPPPAPSQTPASAQRRKPPPVSEFGYDFKIETNNKYISS